MSLAVVMNVAGVLHCVLGCTLPLCLASHIALWISGKLPSPRRLSVVVMLAVCIVLLDVPGCRLQYLNCVEDRVGEIWRRSSVEWDVATNEDWGNINPNTMVSYAEEAVENRQGCLRESRNDHPLGSFLSSVFDFSRGVDQDEKAKRLQARAKQQKKANHDLLRSSKRTNHYVNAGSLTPLLLGLAAVAYAIYDIYAAWCDDNTEPLEDPAGGREKKKDK